MELQVKLSKPSSRHTEQEKTHTHKLWYKTNYVWQNCNVNISVCTKIHSSHSYKRELRRGRFGFLILVTGLLHCFTVQVIRRWCVHLCITVHTRVLNHTSSLSRVLPNSRWCLSRMEEPWSFARGLPDLETHTRTHTKHVGGLRCDKSCVVNLGRAWPAVSAANGGSH